MPPKTNHPNSMRRTTGNKKKKEKDQNFKF